MQTITVAEIRRPERQFMAWATSIANHSDCAHCNSLRFCLPDN